jgi:hypothetical protein
MSEQPREGTRIEVANDELRTVREAMRGLNRMLAAFAEGRASKFVLTRSGKMVAVLRPIEDDCDPAPPEQSGRIVGAALDLLDSLGAPHYHDLIGMTYTLRKEQADNLRAALEPASPTPTEEENR